MASMDSIPNKLRDVGLLERYSTHRHHLNYYNCVVTSAFYIHRAPNPNSPYTVDHLPLQLQPLIYGGLRTLIPQHPMLSVTIVNENTPKPYYSALDRIDLDKIIHIHSTEQNIDEIVQDELCRNFKQQAQVGGPNWRAVVVPGIEDNVSGFWVVFAFHHALTDGLGGFVFHKDLLRSLNSGDFDPKNQISSVVEVPKPKQLSPAMEDMYQIPLGLGYIFSALRDEYLPFTASPPENLWICGDSGNPLHVPPPPEGLRTELLTLQIPTELMIGVAMQTKEKGTRVTPLLEVILSLAFLEVFPHSDSIRVSTVVSVRRWLSKQLESYGGADNVLGTYTTQFREDFTRAAFDLSKPLPSIFSEAQRARETIDKVLHSRGKNTGGGLLRFVTDFDSYFKSKMGQRRGDSLEVSNVGVFKTGAVANMDKWDIGDARFSQSANVTGPAVVCSIVSLESGAMALGFTWQEGIVTKEEMGRVLETTKVLLQLVGSEGFRK